MKRKFMKVIIDLFADPNPSFSPSGSTSNGYAINAYGNTVATSGNDFTPEKAVFYAKAFIKNHQGKLVHGQFGEKLTYPKHSGDVVNIRGLSPYPVKTTPLQEGVTPAPNTMNFYYVEVPVYQYGAFTPITDFASFASRDDVLVRDAEELSSQSGRTIETIDVEALNAGMSVLYAPAMNASGVITAEVNSRDALNNACKFSIEAIFRAVNYLKVQDAELVDGNSYVAIIHPNVEYDVMTNPKFVDIVKYAAVERIFNGEIGKIGKVRFVVSSFAKIFYNSGATKSGSTKYDVYSTLVIGKDAYKVLEIEGQGMQTIIKPLGSGGTADPLNQRATQGWKTTHGIGITGQTCMVRVESTASLSTEKLLNENLVEAARA